ncbi:MAG: SCO family protein [Deltaproteobacteria bacterium]|nr:SCO family protein [Deltaproteobacteria bacterium]
MDDTSSPPSPLADPEAHPEPASTRRGGLIGKIIGHPAFWLVLFSMLFGFPLVLSMRRQLPPPLPVLATVPSFRLTDQEGRPFTQRDLRGKVSVVSFFFSSCTTVCPMISGRMGLVQHRVRQLLGKVQLVSISVDPERDTPERLRRYAESFHARGDVWRFVTGEQAEIERVVVSGFRSALGPAPRGNVDAFDIVHGGHLVLVDPQGRIRGYYEAADADRVKQLVIDVGLMANRETR